MGRRRHHLHEGWVPGGVKCLFTPPSSLLKLTKKLRRPKKDLDAPQILHLCTRLSATFSRPGKLIQPEETGWRLSNCVVSAVHIRG